MQLPSNQAPHLIPGQALSNHFHRQGGKVHEKANELREHVKGQRGECSLCVMIASTTVLFMGS